MCQVKFINQTWLRTDLEIFFLILNKQKLSFYIFPLFWKETNLIFTTKK